MQVYAKILGENWTKQLETFCEKGKRDNMASKCKGFREVWKNCEELEKFCEQMQGFSVECENFASKWKK